MSSPSEGDELDLLCAGQGWLCVNKPSGLLVHAAKGSETDLLTVLLAQLHREKDLAQKVGWNGEFSPSVVHRLDLEVSGVVLVGVDGRVLPDLHRQFENKTTTKIYRAWCHKEKREVSDEGMWRYPLTRKAEGRSKPAGFHKFRVPCETRYRVLNRLETLVELELELGTGRKHQLRRHCALAGHPIVGDRRYGVDDGEEQMYLHATTLCFDDPSTGKRITAAASLPQNWKVS